MVDFRLILAQLQFFKSLGENLGPRGVFHAVGCLAGVVLLAVWLLKTSLGTKALADSVPRTNRMRLYVPFVPLLIYALAIEVSGLVTEHAVADLAEWKKALLENLGISAAALMAIAAAIFVARANFAGGLKAFGLNAKTTATQLYRAILNLIAVWPVLTATILLTIFIGRLIIGQDFQMQQHEALKTLQYPQWQVKLSTIIFTVAIAPVLEETIFRGLVQTLIRNFVPGAWTSILIAAAIFTSAHANFSHWPVLFVLAVSMGYAYEKSGSLLRPIFMHTLFNATAIIAVLNP